MHIAYVCTENMTVPPVDGGAIQTHIAGILPHVGRLHRLTVLCTRTRLLPDAEEHAGVRYLRLPAPSSLEYMRNVRFVIERERFDLIHVFNRPSWVPPFGEAADKGRANPPRLALRIHNAMFTPHKLDPASAEACIRRLSAIDTVSDFMARKIADLYPDARAKLRTIYTGVDLDRFQPASSPKGRLMRLAARGRLGLGDESVILFTGRLRPAKGPHILIAAMRSVLASQPDAILLIVGSRWFGTTQRDDYITELEQSVQDLGDRVRFTGYIPALEIEHAYLAADIFVCASQWEEPLARVHFEAMAAGLPIITTARGGNPEVVYPGVNGCLLHDYQSPEAFAESITDLLQDPARRRTLGEAGRLMAEARFSWQRSAAELLDVYDRVARLGRLHF